MKKTMVFILALVIVLAAFALSQYDSITNAYADDDKCEDGFVCYWAFHVGKQEQKDRCTHKENSQWRFYDPPRPCGQEKSSTNTPKAVIIDDPVVDQPTSTKQSVTAPTVTPHNSDDNRSKPTVTLTPTYITVEDPQQICNWCAIAKTDVAAQERQAAAQETIAASISK